MNDATLQGSVLKEPRIRTVAICLFRRGDRIFVAEGEDPVKGETFYRPLGGSIEFGERAVDTVIREMQEETGLAVKNLRYLFTLENIFTYLGQPGHEIVLVYDGDFTDSTVYDATELACVEANDIPFRAVWKRLDEFGPAAPLYPDGLIENLRQPQERT